MFSVLFWDPAREMFSFPIPFLGRPILWYGFFFAMGFFFGYWVFTALLYRYFLRDPVFKQQKTLVKNIAEKALIYGIIGTVIGARLGDVFFYQDFSGVLRDPWSIVRVWEGGLSSHGGVVGVILALYFFFKREKRQLPFHSFWGFLDLVCIPAAIIGGFIRVGNFINQEIVGTCTTLPIGIIFGHPAGGGALCPRHPVQLYESFFYFFTILVLYLYYRKKPREEGRGVGLFLLVIFGFRILIETVKLEQSAWIPSWLSVTMGQMLSLPFFVLGAFLFFRKSRLHA